MEDFEIECSAPDACNGMTLEIVVNNGVSSFKGIGCGDRGCVGAQISIFNNHDKFITVEKLECEAPSACSEALFDFEGGVAFEECKCGESSTMSCDGIKGIDSCLAGLEKVECTKTGSCTDLQQQVVNVANDFELICGASSSCNGFWLQIVLNNNGRASTNYLKGYKCDKTEACLGAIIQVNNNQKDVLVTVGKIECTKTRSCKDARFIVVGDVKINEIICGIDQSCDGCTVQYSLTSTILPCHSFVKQ